jgi:putative peptide modification system cyclase
MSAMVDQKAAPGQNLPAPLLRTLAVCDLVDSTALTERLGDRGAAELVHKLDRLTRDLLYRHSGREIDKTDGFLVMFERPIQAVSFALAYQRLLREVQEAEHVPLQARIGIHVGDVVLWENSMDDVARGAKAVEVEGLVKPVAARLMSLALPGQILLSGIAYTFALRAQGELGNERPPPEWRSHGRYLFKGIAEPMTVVEVGERGIAPLHRPAYTGKAHREVPWWRRPGMLFLEIALLIAAVAVPAYISLRSPPAIAFADRDWVVVGDLNNLTGEATFNDSVQSAFRIGLEQSRYVNVLSDLKVRETLALMQRDGANTHVDRVTGSEVAIREGARALVLPTLAEIGGRVRFTVEVVDPHTQATVYTESADGAGADSVLPSLDQVGRKLRLRLGEALAVVSKESMPLDKAATKNLDALKAFVLAQNSYDSANFKEALGLYGQALRLDPAFALARANLARTLVAVGNQQQAIDELNTALQTQERLGARDRLYLEVWRESLTGSRREAVAKAKMLAKLYPDFFSGQSLFADFSFEFANRADAEVIAAAERAASTLNPHRNANEILLGRLYLSNEWYDKAAQKFADVERASPKMKLLVSAFPHAARRDFDKARSIVKQVPSPGTSPEEMVLYVPRITITFDGGQTEEASKMLAELRHKAEDSNSSFALIFEGIELSLRSIANEREKTASLLAGYVRDLRQAQSNAHDVSREDLNFQALLGAYIAARQGDTSLANSLLSSAEQTSRGYADPMLASMSTIARAQVDLADKKADEAIRLLSPTVDGSELYLSHSLLMAAYRLKNDAPAALEQAKWLAGHRGRAYAESSAQLILMPINVALSNQAQDFIGSAAEPSRRN